VIAYDIDNKIRVTGTFTDPLSDDVVADPTTVYCNVLTPSGVNTQYEYSVDSEISKTGTGVYYTDVLLNEEGYWYVRWWGKDSNGDAAVADEVTIKCTPHEAD